jgi:hypothetical protein
MKDSTKSTKNVAPNSTEPSVTSSATPVVAKPERGKLMKKTGNAKGGPGTDPYAQPKPSRKFIMSPNAQGRNGATYGIRAKMPSYTAPEATSTQGNGRLLSSAVNRSRPNFDDSMNDSKA